MDDISNFVEIVNTYESIKSAISAGSTVDEIYKTAKDALTIELILGNLAPFLSLEILESLDENQWKMISGLKNLVLIDTSNNNFVCSLPDSFIWRHADKLNWEIMCCSYRISENILREFKHKFNWSLVSKHDYSNEFVNEHADLIDWDVLSIMRELTEDFIELFQDRVNWKFISRYQDLSEDFIKKFSHKINFYELLESYYAPNDDYIGDLLTRAYH